MNKPEKYIRPDDGEVFTLNNDGVTYSLEVIKRHYPQSRTIKWTEKALIECGFIPTQNELSFEVVKIMQNEEIRSYTLHRWWDIIGPRYVPCKQKA